MNLINFISRIYSKYRYHSFKSTQSKYRGLPASIPSLSNPVPTNLMKNISQIFGVNPKDYIGMKGHDGIDFGIVTGTKIQAPIGMYITGLILSATGYGRHVVSKDKDGNIYIFGHAHEWLCQIGDYIPRGQIFMLSGGDLADPYRGYSTGSHLHFEMRPTWATSNNGYYGAVDPAPYFTFGNIEPLPVPLPEPLNTLIVTADILRIRGMPSLSGKILSGTLKVGESIPIYKIVPEDRIWAKISPYEEKYACIQEKSNIYMKNIK